MQRRRSPTELAVRARARPRHPFLVCRTRVGVRELRLVAMPPGAHRRQSFGRRGPFPALLGLTGGARSAFGAQRQRPWADLGEPPPRAGCT
jgi:hypothetical protein